MPNDCSEEALNAECHYAECRHDECRGATNFMLDLSLKFLEAILLKIFIEKWRQDWIRTLVMT